MCILLFFLNVVPYKYFSIKSNLSIVSFGISVALFIFYLDDLTIDVRGVKVFYYFCIIIKCSLYVLLRTFYASYIYISVSFFRFGRSSIIISLNIFSIPFSLFLLEPLLCIYWHIFYYPIDHICYFIFLMFCSQCTCHIYLGTFNFKNFILCCYC